MLRKLLFLVLFALLVPQVSIGVEQPTDDFYVWVDGFRQEAQGEGIAAATIDSALLNVSYLPWVIEADRRQPEFKKTLDEYLAGALSETRIVQGRKLLQANRLLLNRVAKKYRVQAHYLVALWGIETNFGRNTGKVPLVSALATLAYDARRSSYFRGELINLLRIVDSGKLASDQLFGSWAGAMGAFQFMPSTFLGYALDADGDGRVNLWDSRLDALSSAANYLHSSGWQWRQRWGRKVVLPTQFDVSLSGLDQQFPLQHWQRLGVRTASGKNLPKADIAASLVLPEGVKGPAFLVYQNYRVLMRWNKAHSFALSVGMLAEKIAAQ